MQAVAPTLVFTAAASLSTRVRNWQLIERQARPLSEQIELLYDVIERLERAMLEYMVSGSIALSLYAAPRMTRDMDRKETPYRLQEFSNRRRLRLGTHDVWVVAPEDLVLSKLVWALDTGSPRQLDDVRNVLETAEVDVRYLSRWADELGVSELLAQSRS